MSHEPKQAEPAPPFTQATGYATAHVTTPRRPGDMRECIILWQGKVLITNGMKRAKGFVHSLNRLIDEAEMLRAEVARLKSHNKGMSTQNAVITQQPEGNPAK